MFAKKTKYKKEVSLKVSYIPPQLAVQYIPKKDKVNSIIVERNVE